MKFKYLMTETGIENTSCILRQENYGNLFIIPLISLSLVLLSFMLQGHIGLSLQDEGFLWYGASRTLLGEVPIRDFQSYDPGRYYWTALWMKLLGHDLMSMRIALAAFQFVGLTCGLFAASRVICSRPLLILAGLTLIVWMYPRHKIFEHVIAMALVYMGTLLVELPSVRRHFLSGAVIGIVAFFGRNHGVYALAGFSLMILFMQYKCREESIIKKVAAFFFGIMLGYLPMIIMLLCINDYAQAFWESIIFLLELGRTNIALPVPWPWRISLGHQNLSNVIHEFLSGIIFLSLPIFVLVSLMYVLLMPKKYIRSNSVFLSSCFIGYMYIHYVFSRADINHLAQGLHPVLLGLISFPLNKDNNYTPLRRKYIVCSVLLLSILSVGLISPFYKYMSNPSRFTYVEIGGSALLVDREVAKIITSAEKINHSFVKNGEQLLIAPHWPTLYQVLKRRSPLWESYFLHQRSEKIQREMIVQLKNQNTNWIILGDVALDGRDEFRFCNTHRLLWEYINSTYDPIPGPELPANYILLRKK